MQDAQEDGEKTLIGSTCGPQKIREKQAKNDSQNRMLDGYAMVAVKMINDRFEN